MKMNRAAVSHKKLSGTPPAFARADFAALAAAQISLVKSKNRLIKHHLTTCLQHTILLINNRKMIVKMHNDEKKTSHCTFDPSPLD